MALPALPADGLNPWGSALRSALTDISNRADEGISMATDAQADIVDLGEDVDSNTSDIASLTSRMTSAENNISTKAADSSVVKVAGNQNISGTKTFSSSPNVPNGSWSIAATSGLQTALNSKAPINNPSFTGTISGIHKDDVGLANVDNTTDENKPISNATQSALNLKADQSDLNSRIQTHNHTGGVNGVRIPQSAVTGLSDSLSAKQPNLFTHDGGSGQVDLETDNFQCNYMWFRRWGAIAYVTIAITNKFTIGNPDTGNISNYLIGTIKSSSQYSNIFRGTGNSTYDGMVYALSSGADGPVASGYIVSTTGEIKLSALAPYTFSAGNTFSLSGMFLLNSDH